MTIARSRFDFPLLRAMDAGFDLHLTKPVDARALHAALAQLDK